MLWDPFLIKKLIKSVICGTVNSTHMHCSQLTKSTIAGWKQKKKKKREQNVEKKRKREFQLKGNAHIKIFFRMSGGVLILILKGFFFFKVLSLFFIFIWRDYELKTFFKIFLSIFLTSSKSWILGVLVFIFTILDLNVIVTPQIQSFCEIKERAGTQTGKPNFFFFFFVNF